LEVPEQKMNSEKLLDKVKTALMITGDYQDGALQIYIDEVLEYLRDAGIPQTTLDSQQIAGVVARGVSDLWNYGAGQGVLSPYFRERVIQLTLKKEVVV